MLAVALASIRPMLSFQEQWIMPSISNKRREMGF